MWVHAILPESSRVNMKFGFTEAVGEVTSGVWAISVSPASAVDQGAIRLVTIEAARIFFTANS
jgi:hypothetical protein